MGDHRQHDGTDLDTLCGLYDGVRELRAERDRLRDERDMFRDQALPEAAGIMNELSTTLAETESERDAWKATVTRMMEDEERLRTALDTERAQWIKETRHAASRIGEGVRELDRLRAVVRKLVAEIGIEIDGAFLKFAYDEYSGPNPLDPDELAAYERALDESAEATDE
jgi:uncharacterized coiled-coil DUF342 family protein